jgi:hypothetical protein
MTDIIQDNMKTRASQRGYFFNLPSRATPGVRTDIISGEVFL